MSSRVINHRLSALCDTVSGTKVRADANVTLLALLSGIVGPCFDDQSCSMLGCNLAAVSKVITSDGDAESSNIH